MVFQLTMNSQPKWRDGAPSTLNMAIEALNGVTSLTLPKALFGSVSALLTMIRDSMANQQDYVELGLICADACKALDRGLNGRREDELNVSVLRAIEQFTSTVDTIQTKVVKHGRQNALFRLFHAKGDKDSIATWRQDLTKFLQIFNTELAINTRKLVVDPHRDVLTGQAGAPQGQRQSTRARTLPGELPPLAPRTCFGCDELIEKLVGFAQNLEPMALIGAEGIGKTSLALTVLHHSRIKDKFGGNRRFICCDQFPASTAQFLARLSKAIGAEVENPENLIPLRPFLTSQEIFIVVDNAESVFDTQGTDSKKIYDIVDELCQLKTICLCITSRSTTVPPYCKRQEIPTLSMEASRDVFYSIHGNGARSGIIDGLLRRLDFHPLSITLLANIASHNTWDYNELAKAWALQRKGHNENLAATIELSLTSPIFRKLGADARDLLEVVSFFPQGVDERNLDLFFPTISDRKDVFDTFHNLSLTRRINGFITMLAPIRDHLRPQDPKSSPLLRVVKDCYSSRLSVGLDPDEPGFEEGHWIKSEDVNVEYLLDVFTDTPIYTNADDIWVACAHFLEHLYWHKARESVLGPKIVGLPDDHPSKPECLFGLSKLFQSVGKYAEQKRLLSHVIRLYKQRGDGAGVAAAGWLSETNQMLRLFEKGTWQANKASTTLERHDAKAGLDSLHDCRPFLDSDEDSFDVWQQVEPHVLRTPSAKGQEFKTCQSNYILGGKYLSRGERKQAIQHFETALKIASTFSWYSQLYGVHNQLAELFLDGDEFGDAQVHIDKAKSRMVGGSYELGVAMALQASSWFRQSRPEDARLEVWGALEIFENVGAVDNVRACRYFLQRIERVTNPCESP